MAENSASTIQNMAQDTSHLLQDASKKTTQAVLEHSSKYHDAYTTIDKIMDSFWERVPYICIAIAVFIIFWLLTKLFKLFFSQ